MTDPHEVVACFRLELMSNLRPADSGVQGAIIWVSAGEFSDVGSHRGPRIKIMPGSEITTHSLEDAASARLTDPPEVLGSLPASLEEQVVEFVNANRDVLIGYWNLEISTREMLSLLVRI